MIRLALSDLRTSSLTWVGAFLVAVTCGFIGGWSVSLLATSRTYENLASLSAAVLVFSAVAAIVVIRTTLRLIVSAQRRTYALWQLANLSPARICAVVVLELVVVAVIGSMVGTMLEAITFAPLFPWVFSSPFYQPIDHVVYDVGLPQMPMVWIASAGVFLLGGIKGTLRAAQTPIIAVLKESYPENRSRPWVRGISFAALIGLLVLVAFSLGSSDPESNALWSFSMFLPLIVAASLAVAAPVFLPALLKLWTVVVPNRWNAWFLARQGALYGLDVSTSIETPIMVGMGLVAGLISLSDMLQEYIVLHGMDGWNAALDWTSAVLLLGGPVLLCAVGSAVSMIMSSRARSRDSALLTSCGVRPRTLVAAAFCEAFIHGVTALLSGVLVALVSTTVAACAAGMPPFCGLSLYQGLVVAAVGFMLQLIAVLVPTILSLRTSWSENLSAS